MNVERTVSVERRAEVHAALADVTRLRIVDLLAHGDASASELGRALAIPSNLLAHHVKVLEVTGLVARRRSEGDARRTYLSLRGRPTPQPLAGPTIRPLTITPGRMLFVCTANTARSHLAAALWRRASPVQAASAGTHPGDHINPGAVSVATRRGLTLPDVAPCLLAEARRDDDVVITVCDRAHEELRSLDWAHWSIPDPVAAGTDAAFDAAYEDLAERVTTLAAQLAA